METLNILYKLKEITLAQPDVLKSFNWDDIHSCMIAELNCLGEFYPEGTINELSGTIHEICRNAQAAAYDSDRQTILCCISELIGMVQILPPPAEENKYFQHNATEHTALTHYRNNSTVFIGDSHVNFFSGNELLNYQPLENGISLCPQVNNLNFTVLYLGPCLAYTCCKPDSRTQFAEKINYIKKEILRPDARIIISLGEIDIRLHVLKQSEQNDKPVESVIDDIIRNYKKLINNLLKDGYDVCCWGPIASQKDTLPEDPNFPRYGSETDRNNATMIFNQKLRDICLEEGAVYLSIYDKLVNSEGMTKAEYLSADNFHLSQRAMPLAIAEFEKAGIPLN